MISIIKRFFDDPFIVAYIGVCILVNLWLLSKRNVELCGPVKIKGRPLIDIQAGCKLSVGKSVSFNSRNKGYHINLFGPVKIFLDGNNARISIGDKTRLHGSCLHARRSITIGKRCLIGGNCQIIDSHGHLLAAEDVTKRINTKDQGEAITIEDDVWIGINCVILPGVTIGKGSVIGAGSIVTKDIAPMTVAAGNPAREIKSL